MDNTEQLLSLSETAALIGRSKQYTWNCARAGRLPHAMRPRPGRRGRWAIRMSDALAHKANLTETRGRKRTVAQTLESKLSHILEGATA